MSKAESYRTAEADFLQVECPSWHPTNIIKAWKKNHMN